MLRPRLYIQSGQYYLNDSNLDVYFFVEIFYKFDESKAINFELPDKLEFNNFSEFYQKLNLFMCSKHCIINEWTFNLDYPFRVDKTYMAIANALCIDKYFNMEINNWVYIYLCLNKNGYFDEIKNLILNYVDKKYFYYTYIN